MSKHIPLPLVKLNLGGHNNSNNSLLDNSWTSVDIMPPCDIQHDLSCFPWSFEDKSCDYLLASHILEHFTKATGKKFLQECHRILRTNGVLSIAVPDFDVLFKSALSGVIMIDELYLPFVGVPLPSWKPTDTPTEEWNLSVHQYIYSRESLSYILEKLGFAVEHRGCFDSQYEDVKTVHTIAYRHVSFYIDAVKNQHL